MLKAAISIGVAGLGYLVYLDSKRRSHPDYKKKVKARRLAKAQEAKRKTESYAEANPINIENLDLNDQNAVKLFINQEYQLGSKMMSIGNIKVGTEHLCNVLTICPQRYQLTQILHQTMPPDVFKYLLMMMGKREAIMQQVVKQSLFP